MTDRVYSALYLLGLLVAGVIVYLLYRREERLEALERSNREMARSIDMAARARMQRALNTIRPAANQPSMREGA